jgi:hypothetical protein
MGIITETYSTPPERTGLDEIELMRTKAEQAHSQASPAAEAKGIQKRCPTISYRSASLTLSDKCVVYRNVVSRGRVVTIIPFRSIDSFAVQTFKAKWLRSIATFFIVASILIGLAILSLLYGKYIFGQFASFWTPDPRVAWLPFLFFVLGLAGFVAYALHSQTELVIYNRSGNNQVRLPLSGKMKDAVEQFVAAIEVQMREG